MSVSVEFAVETPVFRTACGAVPGMDLVLEQETVTESRGTSWILWAEGSTFGAFEDGLDRDPTVRDHALLSDRGDRRLYRVDLSAEGSEATIYPCWSDNGGVFLAGHREDGTWSLRFEFPDRDAIESFQECCERRSGVSASLRQVSPGHALDQQRAELTQPQREVLTLACENGFFQIPREVTLAELGDELDVSDTAVSQRLRRGLRTVLDGTLEGKGEDAGAERGERSTTDDD